MTDTLVSGWTSLVFGIPALCHLCIALLLLWNRLRTPSLKEAPALSHPAPRVLAVVPARNEEDNIEGCVASLLGQRYPGLRVRVVDDHSMDSTWQKLQAMARRDDRLEIIKAPELPPGWLGKPHALYVGARGAHADYLLFVDADLRLREDALWRAVAVAERDRAALLTVVPRLVAESFWERAVQPLVGTLIFSLLDPKKVSDPRSSFASANGPFLLFSKEGYARIGGHEAVRGEVVEDLRLAQLIKGAGQRLSYLHGTEHASLRMYDSLRPIIQGWTKNFHVALGRAGLLAPLLSLAILWVFSLPTWGALLAASLAAAGLIDPEAMRLPLFAYGADLLGRLSLRQSYGITLRGMRSVGAIVVAYILCSSVYHALSGKAVIWRGRSCPSTSFTSQGGHP